MIGFISLNEPVRVRVVSPCGAVADKGVAVDLPFGRELVWTITSYDGSVVAYDPADRYHPGSTEERMITVSKDNVAKIVAAKAREARAVTRELRAPVVGDNDRRILLQVHEEVVLMETFGSHAVVDFHGVALFVNAADLGEVEVSPIRAQVAV